MLFRSDQSFYSAVCAVVAHALKEAGMNVDDQSMDWGTVVQRRTSKEPIEKGGWNLFPSGLPAAEYRDPLLSNVTRSNGKDAWFGWPDSQAQLPGSHCPLGRVITMGQKVNPIGFRIAVTRDWRSKWYAEKKEFGRLLAEDYKIRELLKKKLESASVPKIQIERAANRCRITIFTARPGVVIGRKIGRAHV